MVLNPRCVKRIKSFENKSFETEFGIENNEKQKLLIKTLDFNQNNIGLYINYNYKNNNLYFLNLPQDITQNISDYLDQYIDISINLRFPESYPFNPPKWSLTNINYNIDTIPLPLKEYYTYLIDKHNDIYSQYWSPAINIEKDILAFIGKINHFEYLILN